MDLSNINGRDRAEKLYLYFLAKCKHGRYHFLPAMRRVQRFLFLPYCYFFLVNWNVCRAGRVRVAYDMLYIFFVLKSFPDNYYPCRLWEKPRKDWPMYWGSNYNPLQRKRLSRAVQRQEYEILYEDKDVCTTLCEARGFPLPRNLGCVKAGEDITQAVKHVFEETTSARLIIAKPSGGKGGHAISVFSCADGDAHLEYCSGRYQETSNDDYVLQEYVDQIPSLSSFSYSLNTVRCVTLMSKSGAVELIGAYMRFGAGDGYVDNLSKGGVAVAVDLATGTLRGAGVDRKGLCHAYHPTSRLEFNGFAVPFWDSVEDLARKVQLEVPYYKLLGMDIGISKHGPVLIEINAIYDNIDLEQVCGPILELPYVRSTFHEYDLFFSQSQKKLFKDNLNARVAVE